MIQIIAILVVFTTVAFHVSSQEPGQADGVGHAEAGAAARPNEDAAVVAMTTPNYPVTPGDRYVLQFVQSFTPTTLVAIVEHDYTLNLGVLGKLDASGLTFAELRREVEAVVSTSYPRSLPRLTIESVGRFAVHIAGEVEASRWITVTALTRLGAVREYFTRYASERRVRVTSADGETRAYDLFAARRYGRTEEDPYLRPGDRILVVEYDRLVTVAGEVRRPGRYVLLAGEGLTDLIRRYAGGPTVRADLSQVKVTRYAEADGIRPRVIYLDFAALEYRLLDQDAVVVPSIDNRLPAVVFEGALRAEDGSTDAAARVTHRFRTGESLADAARKLADLFLPDADLAGAYVLRAGGSATIAVDLQAILYNYEPGRDPILLHPGDRIVIPFRKHLVTVGGAVASPGRYPYVPDRTYEYYVGLAGGPDAARNVGGRARVRSAEGNRRPPGEVIRPEDNIYVPTNNPLAYVTPIATLVGVAVSIVTLVTALSAN